jgi:hypothetical protein
MFHVWWFAHYVIVLAETKNLKTEIGPINLRGTAWAMLELVARAQVYI